MGSNQHILEFLLYYAGFKMPPRYAVMVNGQWGIGKTYLIKEFREQVNNHEFSVVIVSLSGLRSQEEIDKALFRAMHTFMGNKFFEAGASLVQSAVKAWKGVSIDLKPMDLVNRYSADLYIFDDLERCAMPISQALGYINTFVEHGERKVVILANETEIAKSEDYGRIREKVIGRTLEFQSALDVALPHFLDAIKDIKARQFLSSKIEIIKSLYEQSELYNLRIVQQSMWDFERFFQVLEDKHRENDEAMTALLRMLFALSMELKAGRLAPEALANRESVPFESLAEIRGWNIPPSPLRDVRKRYSGSDLASGILSDEALIKLFVKGIVDAEQIRSDLAASTYFVTPESEPDWRTVAYAYERPEDVFDKALASMERSFRAREYDEIGVILHVFGLRIWLSKIGAIGASLDDVVAEGKRYIDDLYQADRLPSASLDNSGIRSGIYMNLAIWERNTQEFKVLHTYLNDKRHAVEVSGYPTLVAELLEEMAANPDGFFEQVAPVTGSKSVLYRKPVFANVDPADFVGRLLALTPTRLRTVLTALEARYEYGLHGDLAAEEAWIRDVRERLVQATETLSPIGRDRIKAFLGHSLDKVLFPPGPIDDPLDIGGPEHTLADPDPDAECDQ